MSSVESTASSSSSSSSAAASAKPHLPHLEGYKSRHSKVVVPGFIFRHLPDEVTRWIPRGWTDIRRMKVTAKLWMFFDGRIRVQRVLGTGFVGGLTVVFILWLEGISPYLALSEDPNTAFKHPHWIKVANERTQREREMRQRIESSSGMNSLALEHATKAYAAHQGGSTPPESTSE